MKPSSRYFEKIRIRRDRTVDEDVRGPVCQWDGCNKPGTHRAPVGRMAEGQYFRFCFDHVREYNKGFNYFSGLSDGEIARYQREAMTGHRPTWRMGSLGETQAAPDYSRHRAGSAHYYNRMGDPLNMFGGDPEGRRPPQPRQRKVKALEARALDTLGLDVSASGNDIKTRYKELVKRHHPDANGGDRGSEERFRDVIQAYKMLKQAGLC